MSFGKSDSRSRCLTRSIVFIWGYCKGVRFGFKSAEKLPLSATFFDYERSGMREHFVLS